MLFLDVVAQPLAMIGEDDDRRLVVPAARLETREERAHDFVRKRDLPVVRGEIRESIGRAVWFVRLVEVQEKEEAVRRQRVQPRVRGGQRLRPRPLDLGRRAVGGHRRKRRIVDVEALPDAGLGAQHEGGNEPPGLVSRRTKHRGQRRRPLAQREPQVVADLVLERQPAGEHRRVGGQRLGRVRVGAVENDRFPRERRQRRRPSRRIAVDRQPIGAERIDDNQDDRPTGRRSQAGVFPQPPRQEPPRGTMRAGPRWHRPRIRLRSVAGGGPSSYLNGLRGSGSFRRCLGGETGEQFSV